jgi:tetratricopeptide (TPR) repeat protein
MGAPTNLPSWRDVNRIVVRSLASSAMPSVGDAAVRAADLILARHAKEKLPPEYQAQLLAEFLHDRYFAVLRHIDSDRPNATHLAIAWLAKLGCVRTVITTNFDRVLEAAFAAVNTPLETLYTPEHFEALAGNLGRLDDPGCRLLKLHGSVDDPRTLIDTLAQRKKGFAAPVMRCVSQLLHSSHWLFLGFSGLDLEAEPNYLRLNQESDTAVGFSWFVREKTEPKPAVVKLKERYGERGAIVYGELPKWLIDFASTISPEPAAWIARYLERQSEPTSASPTSALETGATAWAASLSPNVCALCLGFVVAACAEPQAAVSLVERLIATIDRTESESAASPGSLLMKGVAANALGSLLAGLGRHEDAVRWLTLAVDLAERAKDDDTRDRFRGNLALSLETLGRIDQARSLYESALAGYRARKDPVPIAFGLIALASHLIRQMQLDNAKALAMEAIAYAKTAGDERLRGTALNDVAMIAKLRGEYSDAIATFTDVEQLFTRLGNDDAASAAAGNRGEVLAALGQFDEAERIQMSVLEVNERLERRDSQGATCLSLGLLNQRRGDPVAADHWFRRALETFRAIKDPSNEAFALYRLVTLNAAEQRLELAIDLAQTALPLVSGRNPVLTADLWAQIGQANLRLGYVGRAEAAFRETIALASSVGSIKPLASAEQNLGTALLLQQRNDEAAGRVHARRCYLGTARRRRKSRLLQARRGRRSTRCPHRDPIERRPWRHESGRTASRRARDGSAVSRPDPDVRANRRASAGRRVLSLSREHRAFHS